MNPFRFAAPTRLRASSGHTVWSSIATAAERAAERHADPGTPLARALTAIAENAYVAASEYQRLSTALGAASETEHEPSGGGSGGSGPYGAN